jgi:tRNA(adenine34) deaminase
MYSSADKQFMSLALQEAQQALTLGDYPVGAALTVEGELWSIERNSILSDGNNTAHAEHKLFYAQSTRLRARSLEHPDADICLYTTLEPCLMCLGIAVLHRVSRIIVACPDPHGGVSRLTGDYLGGVYHSRWPKIQIGLYREHSCALILEFLKARKFRSWETMLSLFQAMKDTWQDI